MNARRALFAVLTIGLLWAGATQAQINPFGDSLNLKDSDIALLQAAAQALFTDDRRRSDKPNPGATRRRGTQAKYRSSDGSTMRACPASACSTRSSRRTAPISSPTS